MSTTEERPPFLFGQPGAAPAPYDYTVTGRGRLDATSATATFDGSSAADPFLACLSFYAQSGELLSRVFPQTQVAAGDVAQVSYAPFPGGMTSAATGSGTTSYEQLSASTITVAANGLGFYSWSHAGGSTLVSLGDATKPTLLAAGNYLVFLQLYIVSAPVPSSKYARVGIGSPATVADGTMIIEGGSLGGPAVFALTFAQNLPLGQQLRVQVANDDASASRSFLVGAYTIMLLP